jgi:hypothetical protein
MGLDATGHVGKAAQTQYQDLDFLSMDFRCCHGLLSGSGLNNVRGSRTLLRPLLD